MFVINLKKPSTQFFQGNLPRTHVSFFKSSIQVKFMLRSCQSKMTLQKTKSSIITRKLWDTAMLTTKNPAVSNKRSIPNHPVSFNKALSASKATFSGDIIFSDRTTQPFTINAMGEVKKILGKQILYRGVQHTHSRSIPGFRRPLKTFPLNKRGTTNLVKQTKWYKESDFRNNKHNLNPPLNSQEQTTRDDFYKEIPHRELMKNFLTRLGLIKAKYGRSTVIMVKRCTLYRSYYSDVQIRPKTLYLNKPFTCCDKKDPNYVEKTDVVDIFMKKIEKGVDEL